MMFVMHRAGRYISNCEEEYPSNILELFSQWKTCRFVLFEERPLYTKSWQNFNPFNISGKVLSPDGNQSSSNPLNSIDVCELKDQQVFWHLGKSFTRAVKVIKVIMLA